MTVVFMLKIEFFIYDIIFYRYYYYTYIFQLKRTKQCSTYITYQINNQNKIKNINKFTQSI